ncbi:MAG: hypothetical protein DRJ63_08190 [Thermoprotei archaeon]|nr:MAG: hypothetical protein DRJ63_08190 [Thermoprotei archaeon]
MKELRFDLSQAKTIRRIRQQTDSWSPLAEGQIIAQKYLKPIVCHAGYDVNGVKQAVVWANSGELTGYFEIIDVSTNKQPPGKPSVVYRGKLKKWGRHIWGGNNYIADFSDFKKEGVYWIKLSVKETKETSESYIFEIRRNFYLDLAKKAAKWFYYQRCGVEVPGWHKACHTQDAVILEDGTKIDATGGWHDAGDYGKWIGSGSHGVWALATLAELLLEEGLEKDARAVLDEATWEGKYFCKIYYGKLKTFLQVFTSAKNFQLSDEYPPLENVCIWLGAPEKEPPRVVTLKQALEYYPQTLYLRSHVSASLAKLGRLVSRYDKEFSEKCTSIAKEVFEYVTQSEPTDRDKRSYLLFVSRTTLLGLELYRITGSEKYLRKAEELVQEILSLQDREGFFYMNREKKVKYYFCEHHLVALYEYLKSRPRGDLVVDIEEAFRKWANYIKPLSKLSSFSQVGYIDEKGDVRNLFPRKSSNRFLAAYAWGLATAAILFENREYLEIAEHQIQWILGLNPCDVSMMAGVGAGPGCYHHRYCFIEGHEDGVVPGGVLCGIVGGDGGVFDIGDFRTGNFVVSDRLPVDYPIIDTDARGWTYAYMTNEYWVLNNAWFIMGATQVHRALRKLNI